MTQMFPATMLLLPLYLLMRKLHLVDTLAGVVVAYVATALPFCIWTMKGYYDTIPVDLNEAALIDGCTPLGGLPPRDAAPERAGAGDHRRCSAS